MSESKSVESLISHKSGSKEYSEEVLQCIAQMKRQKARIDCEVDMIDLDKRKLQTEIRQMSDRLAKLNYRLAQRLQVRQELKKTILETEAAHERLIETSQVLCKNVNKARTHVMRSLAPKTTKRLLDNVASGTGSSSSDTDRPPRSSTSTSSGESIYRVTKK